MANLKLDLLQQLRTELYYNEIELSRLAGHPTLNYKEKIEKISDVLKEIALINLKLKLVDQYFIEMPNPQAQQINYERPPVSAQQPQQQKIHPGQTHGE